jgi:hypothetical protein
MLNLIMIFLIDRINPDFHDLTSITIRTTLYLIRPKLKRADDYPLVNLRVRFLTG